MSKKRKIEAYAAIVLLLYAIIFVGCTDPAEPNVITKPELTIELKEAGYDFYTIAINVKTNAVSTIFVVSENDTIYRVENSIIDTIITKASLLPSTTYICRLVVTSQDGRIDTASLHVHTKDTVSCRYIWSHYSLGIGASIIEDMYETREGVIRIVGEFRDETFWNYAELVHGVFRKSKIPFIVNVLGVPRQLTQVRITAVYQASDTDIWFGCETGSVTRQYGDTTIMYYSEDTGMGWVEGIHGIGSDVYFTTSTGVYVCRDNVMSLVYKPVAGSFVDAWLCGNALYAITSGRDPNENASTVVKIENGNVNVMTSDGMRTNMHSIWTHDGSRIYCAGGFILRNDGSKWERENDISMYFLEVIRCTAYDNIVVVGHG